MRPTHALLGLATALACTAPPSSDKREPEPTIVFQAAPVEPLPEPAPAPPPGPSRVEVHYRCDPLDRPAGSLEFVRQQPLEGPPQRFDPDGRYGASGSLAKGGCEIWELEGGVFLGRFGRPRSSADCVSWPDELEPCATWPELERLELHMPASVHTRLNAGALVLVPDPPLGRAGDEFDHFAPGEGAYLGAWFSRDRSRLALLLDDAIELRLVATGELLGTLSLVDPEPPSHALASLYLTWTPAGMPVAVLSWEACDEPEREWCRSSWVWELRTWTSPSAAAEVEQLSFAELKADASDAPATVERAEVDPLGRWLFLHLGYDGGHDQPHGVRQIPLSPKAARAADMSRYVENVDAYDPRPRGPLGVSADATLTGSWISGARTARAWAITLQAYAGEDNMDHELSWASLELTPTPRWSGPHLVASDYAVEQQLLELLGVANGEGVVAWSHCWPAQDRAWLAGELGLDDVGEDLCRGHNRVAEGCRVAGVSGSLDWMLLRCAKGLSLNSLGPAADALEPLMLASSDAGELTHVFGRSGLAIAREHGGTTIHAPDGQLRAEHPQLLELLPATLGPELDRAVARGELDGAPRLVILDLSSGELLSSVSLAELGGAPRLLAFDPQARRLAVHTDNELMIVELAAGRVSKRWGPRDVIGMGWRQDGAKLLTSSDPAWPLDAWSFDDDDKPPSASSDGHAMFNYQPVDYDPSWRWAFVGDDLLLRTLDHLALHLEPAPTVVTTTGLWDGAGEGLYVRIIGDDPRRVTPIAKLPVNLHRPGLLDAFVAGEELPTPVLSEAQRAALDRSPKRQP